MTPGRWFAALGGLLALLFATHLPYLDVPFYWDELGQFVPASLDLLHTGALVPYTTVPNVHPPGVMAWLAGFWRLFGYSVISTRVAMLLAGAAGLAFTFLLARELAAGRGDRERVGFTAAALLFVSPLFFSQAMMAQLDMPAMVWTALAFWLFLRRRIAGCALACAVLVLVKETGIVAPIVFGFCMLRERRWRDALWFFLPLPGLLAWLALLKHATGHLFGSPEFTDYNLYYPLHPVRLGLALVRRIYHLLIANLAILGAAAVWVAARRQPGLFGTRAWRLVGLLLALQIVEICVLGGAVLERYLLPALPFVYAAFALAVWSLPRRWPAAVLTLLLAGFTAGIWINPPFPFPFENNLAWVSFVRLERDAARFAEDQYPGATVASSFPMAGALRRAEFGFVRHDVPVFEIPDFQPRTVARAQGKARLLILYSILWDPAGVLQSPAWTGLLHDYYGYEPPATPEQIEQILHARRVGEWSAAGQKFWAFELPR